MGFNEFINWPIYTGKYYFIMIGILTLLAIFKSYEVYRVPEHLKKHKENQITRLLFCFSIGIIIIGITAAISFTFIQYQEFAVIYQGNLHNNEPKGTILKGILLFFYSNVTPIYLFALFQSKYYKNIN